MHDIDFDEFCVGTVTIITRDSLVLTGTLKSDERHEHDEHHHEEVEDVEVFATLTLTAPVLKVPGNATFPGLVQGFFNVGDRVRINVDNIVTIGPSHAV